ncbi:CoA transferase [Rothia koreensis]|jgi:crotonobetainyl-CoA:carnitine CoA-transferase CaiB-like acyl-CoA transferase|uniref:CaiB/BaiF CoA transferase family protein n=1 Tax=Rothia koreensis TaxID=592378 RepID=UPI003F281CA1
MSDQGTTLDRDSGGPLSGIVVADFSRVLAGPYCTMLLADLGATVIKVEGPTGDDTRQWKPPQRDGESTYYLGVNRGKHGLQLDMKNPDDLQTAYRLIDTADVFIENYKPGGLEKFGLDEASVAQRWPRLIHASITGFGTQGGASLPGYDLLAQAVSGMMDLTGSADGPPQRMGVALFDVVTGLHAAVGILAALRERETSGQGQHLALDLLSSALSGLANQTSGYVGAGNVPHRMGNEHPSLFPYGPFDTNDGQLVICVGNDAQFRVLAGELGRPELAEDPKFSTMPERNRHRSELRGIIEDVLRGRGSDAWFRQLREAGLPCSPILDVAGGVDFAHELGLEPVVYAGSDDDAVPGIKNPIGFSRTQVSYSKRPPGVDQDREAILDWLSQRADHGTGSPFEQTTAE